MNSLFAYISCTSVDQKKPIGRRTGFAPATPYCVVPLDGVLFFVRDT